jgi:A118 family predicted phage portal protein
MRVLDAVNPMTWVNRAIDKRILKMKGAIHMEYNPFLTEMKFETTDKLMTKRLLENSMWYRGNEQDLAYFYRKEAPKFYRKGEQSESLNYFWTNDEQDNRKLHMGIPQLISEKMVDLIVGNGYEIKVEGKNEQEIQEELDMALKDNKFKQLLAQSIETESWSGGVSWKLSYNPNISEYPIIEAWQPEDYACRVVCGRIVEDIFYVYYSQGNDTYRLSEIYGVDDGNSYIDYKLDKAWYKTNAQDGTGGQWLEVPLSTLEETSKLKKIVINGYNKRLSLYKPNKLPNSEFRSSYIGESDYAGSYGAFDALDEIGSTWIQEFRDGKLFRYFPEELMIKGDNGKYQYPSQFKKQHTLYDDSASENADKQKILYEQGELRIEAHTQTWKIWLGTAINNAGLSPLTVGVSGLEAIDASAESQQEREKVSIRTRNKKIEIWEEFLDDILSTYVDFMYIVKGLKLSNTYQVGSLPDVDIQVTFNDYIIKSKRDRTEEVQAGLGSSWDIFTGVEYVHDDKTERERLAISARIKLENGYNSISQAEASALQAENQETADILQEQGIEILPVNENTNGVVTEENDIEPPTEEQEE